MPCQFFRETALFLFIARDKKITHAPEKKETLDYRILGFKLLFIVTIRPYSLVSVRRI